MVSVDGIVVFAIISHWGISLALVHRSDGELAVEDVAAATAAADYAGRSQRSRFALDSTMDLGREASIS